MPLSAESLAAQQNYVFHPSTLISRGVSRSMDNRFIPNGVKQELSAYMEEVEALSSSCRAHVDKLTETLMEEWGSKPLFQDIVSRLDDGHSAWYQMDQVVASMQPPFLPVLSTPKSMKPIYDNLVWKERDMWYREWENWFYEHHPSYFEE